MRIISRDCADLRPEAELLLEKTQIETHLAEPRSAVVHVPERK